MGKPRVKDLIIEDRIQERIQELAAEISRDYRKKKPLLVSILRGSVVFLSDLIRQLDMDCFAGLRGSHVL